MYLRFFDISGICLAYLKELNITKTLDLSSVNFRKFNEDNEDKARTIKRTVLFVCFFIAEGQITVCLL